MKILHIVRRAGDGYAAEIAARQGDEHDVACLLLHDAVYAPPAPGVRACACAADVAARGVPSPAETVDYESIVRLIFDHDKVICW